MLRRDSNGFLLLGIVFLSAIFVSFTCACDYQKTPTNPVGDGSPLMRLIIENQTNQTISVSIEKLRLGDIEPGGQITRDELSMAELPITVKNTQGEIVLSEKYTFIPTDKYHFIKVADRVYKAVILPLDN